MKAEREAGGFGFRVQGLDPDEKGLMADLWSMIGITVEGSKGSGSESHLAVPV